MQEWAYQAPRWLGGAGAIGGHAQTIVAALWSRRQPASAAPLTWRRERWLTPDHDFIDTDWLTGSPSLDDPHRPLLALFHGLEGSVRSHYAQALAHMARERGWAMALPHFRGCSGELNWGPRAYHSGDFEEVGWMLSQLRERHTTGPIVAVGVSMGGNALLRWAQEAGDSALHTVKAIASVCAPLDLTAAGHAIGRGINRPLYTRMFLRTMKPKALAKWEQHPGLFDREALSRARDLYEFDHIFTGPLHGFHGVDDYWTRAAAKPHLHALRCPSLVLNTRNDPFVPGSSLPTQRDVSQDVTLWIPETGGHVGFPVDSPPANVLAMPEAVVAWLAKHLT